MCRAKLSNGLHGPHSNLSRAHIGVTVHTRAARRSRVIVVNQFEQVRAFREGPNILKRIVSAGEHVARINTGTKTRVREALHKVHEGSGLRQHLCALSRRRLEKKRTVGRGTGKERGNGSAHCLDGGGGQGL